MNVVYPDYSAIKKVNNNAKNNTCMPTINPVHLELVGRFFSRFQRIEYSMVTLINSYFFEIKIMRKVFNINFREIQYLFGEIYKNSDITPEIKSDMELISIEVKKIYDIRNFLSHLTYMSTGNENCIKLLKEDKRAKKDSDIVKIDVFELKKLIEACEMLSKSIDGVFHKLIELGQLKRVVTKF